MTTFLPSPCNGDCPPWETRLSDPYVRVTGRLELLPSLKTHLIYLLQTSLLRMQMVVTDLNKQTELFLVNINYYMCFSLDSFNPTTITKSSKVQLYHHL